MLSAADLPLLGRLAETMRADLAAENIDVVIAAGDAPRPGDLHLQLADTPGGPEAYTVSVDGVLTVTARRPAGAYYATRTVLQLLRGAGVDSDMADAPAYRQRGVMLDIGRKYFTPDWIRALIRELGWLKLNTLHLHVNDNDGVRLECRSHPEIVSSRFLSREDLAGILRTAAEHHVTIVPEFDTPSHARAIIDAHPEFALRDRHGTRHGDKIDFSLPAARALVGDVVAEWAELFDGRYFHIGGDEFFAAPWEDMSLRDPDLFPTLIRYASERLGGPATAGDAFLLYVGDLAELLRSHGKNARLWNDHLDPRESLVPPLAATAQVDVWVRWNPSYPSAADLADAGYSLVNRNGDYLYFIVSADTPPVNGARKSPHGIYELWHPHRFMGAAGAGDFDLAASVPVDGAVLSIWCDAPDAMSESDVFTGVRDWLRAFAQRTWGSPSPARYDEFADTFSRVGGAPSHPTAIPTTDWTPQ